MSQGELAGRVAFITGAGSGLGASFARRLSADGAAVVVNDLNEAAAEAVAGEIGGETAVFDVTDSAAFDRAVDDAAARHGRLDIVINNAGIAPPPNPERFDTLVHNQLLRMEGKVEECRPLDVLTALSDEEWDRMLRTHLYGCFHGTRAALRHMTPARSGSIVNISSVLGLVPSAAAPHYSTAKAAILALTRSAAQEVAPLGIRVNAVCPGWVDTPLLEGMDGPVRTMIVTQIPVGRMAEATEIAEVVRFLVGDAASYVTGSAWSASGGFA
jgi:NAD(P)-dependent dehydrogenase (short-subunit alcohol dehydrogenase family)